MHLNKTPKRAYILMENSNLERSILSWKEPFEVEELKVKLKTTAQVGNLKVKLETMTLIRKL